MRRAVLCLAFLTGALVGLSGCAALWLGAGAVGGYAVSRDSITNRLELPSSQIYRVSNQVIRGLGIVREDDEQRGLIQADVEGAHVTIRIKPVSETVTELKVKARKGFLIPKLDVAERVYNAIIARLL